ncbi:hypothetical protein [Streptosporangium sp. KLBMP 9127]|nr:hypothetical protein [Streptosporangium sp. KLBMP 9127]
MRPQSSPHPQRQVALAGRLLRLLVSMLLVGGVGVPTPVALRAMPGGPGQDRVASRPADHGTRVSTGWPQHAFTTGAQATAAGGHGPAVFLAGRRDLGVPRGFRSTPPGEEQTRPLARLRIMPGRAPPLHR